MSNRWKNSGEHSQRRGRWGTYRRPKYNVPVNIIEEDDFFEAWVYCISFKKEDIKILVSKEVIYISGKRTPADDAPNFLLQEYPIKSFERVFELSHKADVNNIEARMEEGVLKIKVPKLAEAEPDMQEVEIS